MKLSLQTHNRISRIAPTVETLLLTAAILGLGFYFFPADPFFINAPFPWIWFASVLVALRYGFGYSLFSVILVAVVFAVTQRYGILPPGFPKVYFVGGLMLTMLCGQFSTLWNQKLRRSTQLNSHSQERLEQISRAYYMLRLSHDRMEQNMITKPVTLRGALTDLRRLLGAHGGELTRENGRSLLLLLAQYCSVESASLHLVADGRADHEPLTSIGNVTGYAANDQLIAMAMEKGVASYSTVAEMSQEAGSRYLVAAPLKASNGVTLGLLLVEKMPFLALNRENLQVLGVLLGYFSDQMFATGVSLDILSVYDDCPPLFAAETVKLARLKRDLGIDSALVSLEMHPHPLRDQILSRLQRQQRGLDYIWTTSKGDSRIIVTLMPFSGMVAIDGYFARISASLQADFELKLTDPAIKTRFALLGEQDTKELYAKMTGRSA